MSEQQSAPLTTLVVGTFASPDQVSALPLLNPDENIMAVQIANATKVESDPTLIASFGSETERVIAAAADPFLEQVRVKDAGSAGQLLHQLTSATEGLNFDLLKTPEPPTGLKALFNKGWDAAVEAKRQVEAFLAQYDTLAGQIRDIEHQLQVIERELFQDMTALKHMVASNISQYRQHLIHIAAGELILSRLKRDWTEMRDDLATGPVDLEDQAELQMLETSVQMFEIRLHDLKLVLYATELATANFHTLAQANLWELLAIKRSLGPGMAIFKQAVTAQVIAMRTKDRIEFVDSAAKSTNAAIAAGSKATQAAALAVASSVNRGVVDVKVLREATETFKQTVTQVRGEFEMGSERRAKEAAALEASRSELQRVVVALDDGTDRYLKAGS